ncbi:TIGR03013 family XrtA/PEP-CTERM system glycosyltransferase [Janthinobacterium sp. 17J80-10]|uniref:TIGR03013 family XrtA/PEP-CTERM system glycosyltransferase n=1 Tax=Janthinobacterium sp. 17J80-10 TaxID=2497863 RepID=UPI0010057408|nr:TIGR03013 family XrtA/PEP-CTERM system glycosyltransferase [Janthinobacterium sp. 17J80-10]QAU35387.1 TIGR03013 family PEP-CTERM/XrtA system glycosyltransferase [Janthinobacterium sp. 17J80-10]
MLRISNHHVSKIISVLFLVEVLVLLVSVYLGTSIRFGTAQTSLATGLDRVLLPAAVFTVTMLFSMSALGMYQLKYREGLRNTLLRLMPAFALGFGILTLLFYLLPDLYFGRGILGLVILISAAGILLTRVLIFKSSEFGLLESRLIFLGSGSLAKECGTLAKHNIAYHKYHIVGYVPVADEDTCIPASALLPGGESLVALAASHNVGEIIVSVQNRRGGNLPIKDLLDCKLNGIKVTDAATFFEREACQIRVDSLQPSWLVFGTGFDQSFLRAFCKRSFDLFVSLIIFTVSIPAMLVTTICIYLEDRGPILYKQERVGKDGQTYMVLKFRSMRNDAEKAGKPQWAQSNDPRTTRIGNIIRKLRIDELPQILNVLKGEMSFVGPRPERPFFVQQLNEQIPYYNVRHSIKPGITGMAQVRYPYGASVEDAVQKLQYDLYYVKNNSLFLDILILIDTLQVVLLGKGAR